MTTTTWRIPAIAVVLALALPMSAGAQTPVPSVSSTLSTVSTSAGFVLADGAQTATITATLRDTNGNPVSGKTLRLDVGGGSSMTTGPGSTNASGVVTFTGKNLFPETVTYGATDTTDGVTIAQTVTVSFVPVGVSSSASFVAASPGSVPADGVQTAKISVTLNDDGGHRAPGRRVALTANRGSSVISGSSGPSDPNGVVSFTVSNSVAETVTYSATDTTDRIALTQTATVTFTAIPRPAAVEPPSAPPLPHDGRHFAATGFRIDHDGLWGYFNARGGVDVFGYPVSRPFELLGCTVQMFQRQIAQACRGEPVRLMNLLDDLFPFTHVNFATLPDADAALRAATPRVGDPNYDQRILQFVRDNTPDRYAGEAVGFQSTFFGLVTGAMLDTSTQGIIDVTNLEVWGAPTSAPMMDPNNSDFVYQRFQRGVMHYIVSLGSTRALLLADYVKQIVLDSADLPIDLRDQARGSPTYAQYCPSAPRWVCRPADLPESDLTFAFEAG